MYLTANFQGRFKNIFVNDFSKKWSSDFYIHNLKNTIPQLHFRYCWKSAFCLFPTMVHYFTVFVQERFSISYCCNCIFQFCWNYIFNFLQLRRLITFKIIFQFCCNYILQFLWNCNLQFCWNINTFKSNFCCNFHFWCVLVLATSCCNFPATSKNLPLYLSHFRGCQMSQEW